MGDNTPWRECSEPMRRLQSVDGVSVYMALYRLNQGEVEFEDEVGRVWVYAGESDEVELK